MLKPKNTKQFKKDLKKYEHRPHVLEELYKVIEFLLEETPLPEKYRDHNLINNWTGHRECHVRNDVLLIYTYLPDEEKVRFDRLGSHSELLDI